MRYLPLILLCTACGELPEATTSALGTRLYETPQGVAVYRDAEVAPPTREQVENTLEELERRCAEPGDLAGLRLTFVARPIWVRDEERFAEGAYATVSAWARVMIADGQGFRPRAIVTHEAMHHLLIGRYGDTEHLPAHHAEWGCSERTAATAALWWP